MAEARFDPKSDNSCCTICFSHVYSTQVLGRQGQASLTLADRVLEIGPAFSRKVYAQCQEKDESQDAPGHDPSGAVSLMEATED